MRVGPGLLASFALFAAAPLPSAQMFEAAGLARIRLRPLLVALLLGRLVSYSIYVSVASAGHDRVRHFFDKGLFSPQAIATQVVAAALLIAMVTVDWPSVIDKGRAWVGRLARQAHPAAGPPDPPARRGTTAPTALKGGHRVQAPPTGRFLSAAGPPSRASHERRTVMVLASRSMSLMYKPPALDPKPDTKLCKTGTRTYRAKRIRLAAPAMRE